MDNVFATANDGWITHGNRMLFDTSDSKQIIGALLTRKQRNNGVGRYMHRMLTRMGACSFKPYPCAEFTGVRLMDGPARYAFRLEGSGGPTLLRKLNANGECRQAIRASERRRDERRRLRAIGQYPMPTRVKQPRPIAGANGRLKRHFRKSDLTWNDAAAIIARASRLPKYVVHERLRESLDERGVATLWLKSHFVFRVDLPAPYRGLINLSGQVRLYSTNDNASPVYRRLRTALRKCLERERRERKAIAEEVRAWRKCQRLIASVA